MRILIISYYFPPFMNVGGFRAMSWARRFHDAGHEVTVIKGEGREAASCAYFEEELGRELRVLAVRNPLLAEASTTAAPPAKPRFEALKDVARAMVPTLDGYVAWSRAALAAARAEATERGDFDAVVSTSFPLSAHEAAYRLSRGGRAVWVADFRDFYGQFGSNKVSRRSPRGAFLARRLAAYGRRIDLAVTVSGRLQSLLEPWLGGTESMVLYNGYFIEHLPLPEAVEPDWSILYTGSYNSGEFTLAPLVEALSILRAKGVAAPRLRFSGERNEAVAAPLEAAGFIPEFLGAIDNRRALDLQRRAGFLLLCDAMSGPGALLTKTFEYLAARRPVIAITRPDSDLRETVFNQPADGYVATLKGGEIAEFLLAWRERGTAAGAEAFYPPEKIEFYSRERQADLLLERITSMVAAGDPS